MTPAPWQQIVCGQERWWIAPQWEEALLNPDGLRFNEWSQEGKVEIIKHSMQRTVYRIGLEHKPVYIKHYPVNTLRSRLRLWLRQAKARIEWRRTVMLQERALPTITPIAVGQHAERGSYLITEELPDAQPLNIFLDQHWDAWKLAGQTRDCLQVIKELSQFLAQLLLGGIVHDDLHPGNVLIHQDPSGKRNWFLIDLFKVRHQTRLSQQAILQSLALMSQSDWYRMTRHEQLRGWVWFRRACKLAFDRQQQRSFLEVVSREVHRRSFAVWNQRAHRCTRANRDFMELRVRRSHAWASRVIPADWLVQFLHDPEQPLHAPHKILKTSRHSLTAVIPGTSKRFLFKKFSSRHSLDFWLGSWRRSPAMHCYRMAHRLHTAFIPTARPLAVVEIQRSGQVRSSYLLTEYLENTIPLAEYWLDSNPRQRLHTLQQLARIIQRLHAYRMTHRDLKVANILARPHTFRTVELFLIDLRGAHYSRLLTSSRKKKDLARLALSAITSLHCSRTDLLRFLHLYLPPRKRQLWRNWWLAIAGIIDRKISRNQARNRIVS